MDHTFSTNWYFGKLSRPLFVDIQVVRQSAMKMTLQKSEKNVTVNALVMMSPRKKSVIMNPFTSGNYNKVTSDQSVQPKLLRSF